MRLVFTRPCEVAVRTPEGDMTRFTFGVGEVCFVEPVCEVVTLEARPWEQTRDFTLVDGTVLIGVPTDAFMMEFEDAHCV